VAYESEVSPKQRFASAVPRRDHAAGGGRTEETERLVTGGLAHPLFLPPATV
jgi:hypothetical protein